ncbi:MAG: squalene/phytoene synthase family protein, partial [Paracoccaceae bacterium]
MTLTDCARLVERGDRDRFAAAMTASEAERAILFPLYALNLEVARVPWVTQEPMIAEMRLQFWLDMIDEIAEGAAPRTHIVAQPLAEVISANRLPAALFSALISARRWDIHNAPFADQIQFDQYIDETSGHLMWLAALALGAPAGAET